MLFIKLLLLKVQNYKVWIIGYTSSTMNIKSISSILNYELEIHVANMPEK